MLKAVIMDFDGVIIDTELMWHQVTTQWFKETHDYDLPMAEFGLSVGSSEEALFDFLATERGIVVDRQGFYNACGPAVQALCQHIPVKAGVTSFIQSVKAAGLGLALATSSDDYHAHTHLKRLGLFDYFDAIVTRDQVTNIKPAPDLFLRALSQLGVAAHEAVIIEDSVNGLRAGISAGIRVINIPTEATATLDFTGCHLLLTSIDQVVLDQL